MITTNNESITNYFEKLIEYHHSIFGISEKAALKEINYLNKYTNIFSFIDLLQHIDEELNDSFVEVILHDIVKLLQQNSLSQNNSHQIELAYLEFCKKLAIPLKQDSQYKEFIQIIDHYKPDLDALLNTKFYYLDKYICYQISKSQKAQYFLASKNIFNMKSIIEYISKENTNSFMRFDFKFFATEETLSYHESQLEFIKSLAEIEHEENINEGVEQLIRYKNHIPFFDNLEDRDIKDLITDVSFKQYKKYEPVIVERDKSTDIFFLVKGSCKIMFKGKEIGTIPSQSIFGEFAFITKERRSATIKATRDSIIISFKFDLDSFENNPCIYSKLYNNISNILVKKLLTQNQ